MGLTQNSFKKLVWEHCWKEYESNEPEGGWSYEPGFLEAAKAERNFSICGVNFIWYANYQKKMDGGYWAFSLWCTYPDKIQGEWITIKGTMNEMYENLNNWEAPVREAPTTPEPIPENYGEW